MTEGSDKLVMSDVSTMRPQCHFCLRWTKGTLTCVAFDRGIPQNILSNEVNHFVEHVAGDAGLLGIVNDRLPVLHDLIKLSSGCKSVLGTWNIAESFSRGE